MVIASTTAPINHISDENVSWHVGLNYKPTDATLVYLSAAESTKSGGFFNGITFASEALAPYRPEHLTDYEAGLKTSGFDHRLQLDGSVFYYDYQDYQAQTFTNVGAVSLIKLSNIAHANVYGLDLGVTLKAPSMACLHARGPGPAAQLGWGPSPFATPGGGPITAAGRQQDARRAGRLHSTC